MCHGGFFVILSLLMDNKDKNKEADTLNDKSIQMLSVVRPFKALLQDLRSHADCHNRKLHYDQYVSLILLYFFNPTLTSLRSLQKASTLKSVQKKLGMKSTSLGSLSESSNIFDPELLKPIMTQLASKAKSLRVEKRLDKLDGCGYFNTSSNQF